MHESRVDRIGGRDNMSPRSSAILPTGGCGPLLRQNSFERTKVRAGMVGIKNSLVNMLGFKCL